MSILLLLLGHSNFAEIRALWCACPVPRRLLEFSAEVATQGVMGRTWSPPLNGAKIENLKNRLGTRQVARAICNQQFNNIFRKLNWSLLSAERYDRG